MLTLRLVELFPLLHAVEQPLGVGAAGLGREHHKFGNFVRMHREKRLAQSVDSLLCSLDKEELLAVVLDRVLPPVDRFHAGENVDARGDALLDERFGERGGVEIGADSGQDDDGLHGAAVRAMASAAWRATSCAALRIWPKCTNGSASSAQKKRPPTPTDGGTTEGLFFDRAKRSMSPRGLPAATPHS